MVTMRQLFKSVLALALFVFLTSEAAVTCPNDWTYSADSDSCIRGFVGYDSWVDARYRCKEQSGDLVKIISEDMNDIAKGLANSLDLDAWIGLTDIDSQADEMTWVWLDETDEATWTDWYTGYPDYVTDEDCACVNSYNNYQWINSDCGNLYDYICEIFENFFSTGKSCPMGWIASETSQTCLKFFEDEKTWQDSRVDCKRYGGDLVKIVDEDMNKLIMDQFTADTSPWIGINDLSIEGRWVWLDETSEADYTYWYTGYPNGGQSEDCGYIRKDSYYQSWLDQECSYECAYVCEIGDSYVNIVDCPSGWTSSSESGTCLQLSTDEQDWDGARRTCQSLGGDLVKIVNNKMDRFINELRTSSTSNWIWIGLNDRVTENVWVWLDETTLADYTNWYSDDSDVLSNVDCAITADDYNQLWLDIPCSEAEPYICEKPGSAITTVSCPMGSIVSEQSKTCLSLYMEEKDWDDARAACKSGGGDLVKIVNEEMNDLIVDQFATDNRAWIGLNDLAVEGKWVWNEETTEAAYQGGWYYKGPSDETDQNCVVIADDYNNDWIDSVCSLEFPYICEYPATITTAATITATTTTLAAKKSGTTAPRSMTDTDSNPPVADESGNSASSSGISVGAVVGIVLVCLVVILVPLAYFGRRYYQTRGLFSAQPSGVFSRQNDTVAFVNNN